MHVRDEGGSVLLPATPLIASTTRERYSVDLPRTAASARLARLLVSSAHQAWALEDLEYPASLVMSELVANAVQHAGLSRITVTVMRRGPLTVRVAVADRSPTLPRLCQASAGDEQGRGLAIVNALCDGQWGVEPLPCGKRVWADLNASDREMAA